jgi:hypothetical protein
MPSRREMIRMTPDEIAEYLGGRRTLNLASFGPDGTIHLVAMWYGFLDASNAYRAEVGFGPGEIVIETFGKSQKVANFRRNSRFTALVESGEEYNELAGVELVGTVSILEEPADVIESCKAVLSRYQTFNEPGDLDFAAEFAANKRVCVKLRVERIVSWDHNKLDVAY